jgi:hypothetical protein
MPYVNFNPLDYVVRLFDVAVRKRKRCNAGLKNKHVSGFWGAYFLGGFQGKIVKCFYWPLSGHFGARRGTFW